MTKESGEQRQTSIICKNGVKKCYNDNFMKNVTNVSFSTRNFHFCRDYYNYSRKTITVAERHNQMQRNLKFSCFKTYA